MLDKKFSPDFHVRKTPFAFSTTFFQRPRLDNNQALEGFPIRRLLIYLGAAGLTEVEGDGDADLLDRREGLQLR